MSEILRSIPGFDQAYEIDYHGNIRRTKGKGQRTITPVINDKGVPIVRLTIDGKRKEYTVHRLMADTYLPAGKKGQVLHHRNGNKKDNSIGNLFWINRSELGRKTGASSKSQPVRRVDADGNIVSRYSSAREAAKANFMSYQTIMDRCNGKCKTIYAPDGYCYEWDKKQKKRKPLSGAGMHYREALPPELWHRAELFLGMMVRARAESLRTGQKANIDIGSLPAVFALAERMMA